jgi:hypothetical protein
VGERVGSEIRDVREPSFYPELEPWHGLEDETAEL